MEDFSGLMSGIEFKTHQLIKQIKEIRHENAEMKKKIDQLIKKEQENLTKIKYLEENNVDVFLFCVVRK